MPELTQRRRMLILAICCMSLLIVAMDGTIVNVALPSIRTELDASLSSLQWTIDAYLLVLASLLMLSGSTADRLGRRRTFQIGLALFTLGSLLCSIAPNVGWLIAFRMVQAIGGSMLNPVAMSIITNVFTEPRERARAIGMWGAVAGISLALGPVVGGLLTETIGWRSIFWVNVPIGIAAIILTALFVPESKAATARRFDPIGQLLVVLTLATLVYAIIEAPALSWTSPEVIGLLLVAVASLVGLIWYKRRRRDPLIDLRFFKSAPFSGATIISICAFAAFGGFLFLNTLYLQEVRGLSPLEAGLYTVPLAVANIIASVLSGRMVGTYGSRPSVLIGGVALTASSIALTQLEPTTAVWYLLVTYFVFGIGAGIVNAPITNAAVSGMPRAQAGVASAIASTSRQIGQSLGVAIAGSIAGAAAAAGFTEATHPAWWVLAALGVVVFALGLVTTGPWARRTTERLAEELRS